MNDLKEWGQTIIWYPGDDENLLWNIMEAFQREQAERRGDEVVTIERQKLPVGIAAELYENLEPDACVLGIYVQTRPLP